jgi:thioredoxin reductase
MEENWDVVVIGGGPAGLSAALMLGRARRRVLVVDAGTPRNRFAPHMHGVLGHDGKPPQQLIAEGRREVESYGVVVHSGTVTGLEAAVPRFTVTIEGGERVTARRVILATGLRDEVQQIPGLADQWGTGAVMCPYCDGWEVRDSGIGIVASGPDSVHQAQLLRQWSPRVTYFRCGTELPDEQRARLIARGISVEESPVVEVLADAGKLTGVALDDGRVIPLDSIFTWPTPAPLHGLLLDLGAEVADSPFGVPFVITDPFGKTTVDGVWAIGNVATVSANVPLSMGMGSFAGAAVNADLIEEEIEAALRE